MSELKERSEEIESLVRMAQAGDADAFARVYDLFVDPIYRYIYYRVNEDDAEDIVEDTFLKAWKSLRQYSSKGKNFSFSAWIFRIAHNLVIDYYRAGKERNFDEIDETLPDDRREHNPIRTVEDVMDSRILRIALGRIKKVYRDFVIYKFINELSNREIADIIGKSEGALRIIQHRALRALRAELEVMGVDYRNVL